jgi:hypothetical protein
LGTHLSRSNEGREQFAINVKPKPIAAKKSLATTTHLATGQPLNDFKVPEADFGFEHVSAPASLPVLGKATTKMETEFSIPKTDFTFDATTSFAPPFVYQTAKSVFQQPSNPFANIKPIAEANTKTQKENKLATVVGQSLPSTPVPKQSKSTLEPRTLSIFDQPLPAGPSPFSNPFSKLTQTAKSITAPSVLDEASPSASALSDPFASIAARPTPSKTPSFRNAMKLVEKKAAATTKLLPSSLVVKGKFYVLSSKGFDFKLQEIGGGQKNKAVVAVSKDGVVVNVDVYVLDDSQISVDLLDQTSEMEEDCGTADAKQLPVYQHDAFSSVDPDVLDASGDPHHNKFEDDDDDSDMMSAG